MSEINFDLATAMQTVTRERASVVMSFLFLNMYFYLLFIVVLLVKESNQKV